MENLRITREKQLDDLISLTPFFKDEYILCASIWYFTDKGDTQSVFNTWVGISPFDNEHYNMRGIKPYNTIDGYVISDIRHPQIICKAKISNVSKKSLHLDGFLTNYNRFITRGQAYTLAKQNGQIKFVDGKYVGCNGTVYGDILYSEDLWYGENGNGHMELHNKTLEYYGK